MMFVPLIIKGIILGLVVSIPLGPVGALCIQRTISKGYKAGLLAALGAAFADLVFALIAGFGVSVVIDWLINVRIWIQSAGAIVFMFMAWKVFFTNPAIQVRRNRHRKNYPLEDFMTTCLLTLSNPTAVFVMMAAFAGFFVQEDANYIDIILSVTGVFTGCLGWWLLLTSLVNRFRSKIRLRHLLWINKITGVLVFIFAVILLVGALR
jgi:threonine/homoserine/homoserine lactone efflux protein